MAQLDPPPIGAVCALFDLGTPQGRMTPVSGGPTHRMWRLETDRGAFAIKQINRNWANPDYGAWYERAFAAEMMAFDAGVPMPRPIPVAATGVCLAEIDVGQEHPLVVRAHDWVDGEALRPGACGPAEARAVGGMLARVHAPGIQATGSAQYQSAALDPDHWRSLRERGAAIEWGTQLESLLPIVDELIARGKTQSDEAPIMSHRDTDAKNILRASDGRLLIIDWDATGPVVPREEVAIDAIVWGGAYVHDPDPVQTRAFIAGYRAGGGVFETPRAEDFAEFVRNMLGWLLFNLRRTLGERLASDDERALARRLVGEMLGELPRYASSLEAWARMLDD